jgi:uncharacterized membrane protein (UPF0127 family)
VRAATAQRRIAAPLALAVCTGPVERARGLLREPEPPPGSALWIAPCRAVHTCGMRYAIDVVFLDRRGLVLRIEPGVPPGRVLLHADAASVLELRSGECERLRLRVGERLGLPAPEPRSKPVAREGGARPALVVALALVLATAWMLGGCAAAPRLEPQAPAPAARTPAAAPSPADEELALAAGLEYHSRAWPAAAAAYAELCRRQPDVGEHWYRLGIAQLQLGGTDAAARALETAARLGARPHAVHESLAAARLAQAAEALRRARAADALLAAVERLLPVQLGPGAGAPGPR